MSNLIDIQGQIEKLQKQASDIKSREFDKTVQDILAKMHAFGITVKDLQPGKRRATTGKAGATTAKAAGAKRKTAGRKTGQVVAAKYRGPNGETWSGRGLAPRWLASLIAAGKTKQDFAIKAA